MLKGFKEFISRGNVMELAIAVVIGTATTAMVTAVVNNLIKPLIAAIGGTNIQGLALQLVDGNPKSTIDLGAIITAVINFFIIAAAVYFFLVVPLKKILDRRKKEEVAEATETELLTEIRDLLRERNSS
ncbi:large conductance mechanosensitive channel protein MscL [Sciscionella sediminilitoris]|uniref:large conductance mechanosensitive channel protein MscL n=1 Tax=Sciscionella sediminilitoris TaxID=1445613 RepID=UPI0004DF3695|nr:large conductance mechanosensitive channel protein MscL [Sciscionella sp. SE31]